MSPERPHRDGGIAGLLFDGRQAEFLRVERSHLTLQGGQLLVQLVEPPSRFWQPCLGAFWVLDRPEPFPRLQGLQDQVDSPDAYLAL